MGFIQQAAVVAILALTVVYLANRFSFKTRLNVTENINDEYDYVIVGGGTAGSVLASRLSEDKETRVLLIEAGGHYEESPFFEVPIQWMNLQGTEFTWTYETEVQTHAFKSLKGNRAALGRGRILGGTSALNLMHYARGSKYDYDEWAANGCSGWGYKDVLPYFLKSEDILIDELKSSKYHSTGGPLAVSEGRATPLADLYMEAGKEMGYNITDSNGDNPEGFNNVQLTTRHGVRSSTGNEFLGNVDNSNLHIALRSVVTKINIHNKRANGVFYIRNERKHFVKATKEVILSAGAINSPQLLMLSGIGPKGHLEKLNIPVLADLPVGNNLQDHQMAFLYSTINMPYGINAEVLNSWWANLQYAIFGKGPKSISGNDGSGFFYIDPSKRGKNQHYTDIQLIMVTNLYTTNGFGFKDDILPEVLANQNDHGFSVSVSVSHPRSRGVVRLRSTDPFDFPILDPKYLTDKRDAEDFVKGIRIWEEFVQTPTMQKLGVDIHQMKLTICSDHEFRSDAYWECFVRHLAVGCNHHTGTCKMGSENDPSAVVDPQLRVKGIKGLRVVDTSIIPNITSGNTMAPAIMVAEKAADMIRGIDTVEPYKFD